MGESAANHHGLFVQFSCNFVDRSSLSVSAYLGRRFARISSMDQHSSLKFQVSKGSLHPFLPARDLGM